MEKIILCIAVLLISACTNTTGLEMPNSPCACSYDGQQPIVPSDAEFQTIMQELVG